jgi:hypothetical protein
MAKTRDKPAAKPAEISLSRRQALAWAVLHDPAVSEVLYGGAKGGGKSILGCYWVWLHALEIAREYKLRPSDTPLPVGWMGCKRAVDFQDRTWEKWLRFIPAGEYRVREQAREVIIRETVKVGFGGLDSSEQVERFNSQEFAFFFLDQAEEVEKDDIAALRASLRLVIGTSSVPRKALLTANPAQCWLKDEFITAPRPNQRFIKALPTDNPWLPGDYAQTLREAFGHHPGLLRAYLEGDWSALSATRQMISWERLEAARGLVLRSPLPRKLITCDPAREGDDETVIYALLDTDIIEAEIYGKRDEVYTLNALAAMSRKHGQCPVVVDGTGFSSGFPELLGALGVSVIPIISAGAAGDKLKFINVRAEMWDWASRQFASSQVQLSHRDSELDRQLCAVRYDFAPGGRWKCELKADVKKRLGRSPDRADCYVMGLYALAYLRQDKGFTAGPTVWLRSPEAIPTPEPAQWSQAWFDRQEEMDRVTRKGWR